MNTTPPPTATTTATTATTCCVRRGEWRYDGACVQYSLEHELRASHDDGRAVPPVHLCLTIVPLDPPAPSAAWPEFSEGHAHRAPRGPDPSCTRLHTQRARTACPGTTTPATPARGPLPCGPRAGANHPQRPRRCAYAERVGSVYVNVSLVTNLSSAQTVTTFSRRARLSDDHAHRKASRARRRALPPVRGPAGRSRCADGQRVQPHGFGGSDPDARERVKRRPEARGSGLSPAKVQS